MAASPKVHSLEKLSPTEEWTVVLPRRGKKNKPPFKSAIPKQEKEAHQWVPVDTETDPERELKLAQRMQICIQKLSISKFFNSFLNQMEDPDTYSKFLKVLGSEQKMSMVIYGIGSIESFDPPRLQLSLAILMKRKFEWIGEIQVFDPIISLTESKVLTSLGCDVLSVNEQGRRRVVKPTLFFMPHCEAELYENLLEANWGVDQLNRLILFGNSFGEYEHYVSICGSSEVKDSRKRILDVRRFSEEIGVDDLSDDSYFRAFHGSCWHFFAPVDGNIYLLDEY